MTTPEGPGTSGLRILQIAYKFPPLKSIGAFRNYQYACQWTKLGASLVVLTTSNRSSQPAEVFPLDERWSIRVIPTLDYKRFIRFWRQKPIRITPDVQNQPIVRFLFRLKESFPTNLLFDEGGLFYIWQGVRAGKRQIEENGITMICSSFRPISDHMIAWWLKGRFPHVRWIADYRDVHVDENRTNTFFPALQHILERYMLRRADLVTTVSKGLASFLERYDRPLAVLRNGIPQARLSLRDPDLRLDKFTINYTGTIYPDKQDPDPLCRALQVLIKAGRIHPNMITIRCVGKDYNYWDEILRRRNLIHCAQLLLPVDLNTSLSLQKQAHINVLLSWSGPVFSGILTGKMYEYISARRPIMALINGSHDEELSELILRYNQGQAWSSENLVIEELADWIAKLYQLWCQDMDHEYFHFPGSLSDVSWDRQMDEFLQLIPFHIPGIHDKAKTSLSK